MYVFIHILSYSYVYCYKTPPPIVMPFADRGTTPLGINSQIQVDKHSNFNTGIQPQRAVHLYYRVIASRQVTNIIKNVLSFLILHQHQTLEKTDIMHTSHVQVDRNKVRGDLQSYPYKPP